MAYRESALLISTETPSFEVPVPFVNPGGVRLDLLEFTDWDLRAGPGIVQTFDAMLSSLELSLQAGWRIKRLRVSFWAETPGDKDLYISEGGQAVWQDFTKRNPSLAVEIVERDPLLRRNVHLPLLLKIREVNTVGHLTIAEHKTWANQPRRFFGVLV